MARCFRFLVLPRREECAYPPRAVTDEHRRKGEKAARPGGRERFGLDGKARATSMSAATCEERETQPDSPKRPRPPGCAAFPPLRRCSSVTDLCWYALSSRLGETKNRQQRGMAEYFNRLLAKTNQIF